MKSTAIIINLLLLSFFSFSQETKPDKKDNNKTKNSSFQINFSTVPTQAASGPDTTYANTLSIAPVVDLRTASGWGISYSPAFVTSGAIPAIYMHTFSGGFERYGRGKTDLAFNFSHFIATNKTGVPYTPISNELFFYSSYTGAWLHPLINASFGFGKDSSARADNSFASQLGVQAGFNHSFYWEETGPFSSIDLTPAVVLNAGNNQYFSFLSASKYMAHSAHLLKRIRSSGRNKRTNNVFAQLRVSNVELNTGMLLEAGRFSLAPEGSIFLPIGSADHGIYGYWQLGVHYRF
ncbi:MAG TPA: hypothetical protein VNR87_06165 [Flavisolibacter sp.]|nr:hypothetical protein [Flavisolibacter sp.]